jgi:hypothetical protein
MIDQLISLFATAPSGCSHPFFGLIPWFKYLKSSDFGGKGLKNCDINSNFTILPGNNQSTDIPSILLAVIDDLLRLAGLIAVAFVIYGAIKFITSQGSADGVANAQATVINALIGLAIAIVAITFVGFIGNSI